jgi:hypothetical protein
MGEGEPQEAAANKYTFGDNLRASARLRRLAEMYEPESRELLRRSGINAPRLAVDLGCGRVARKRRAIAFQENEYPVRSIM